MSAFFTYAGDGILEIGNKDFFFDDYTNAEEMFHDIQKEVSLSKKDRAYIERYWKEYKGCFDAEENI